MQISGNLAHWPVTEVTELSRLTRYWRAVEAWGLLGLAASLAFMGRY